MSESTRRIVQTVCGIAGIIMLVVGLSALAVVRADNSLGAVGLQKSFTVRRVS